MNLSNDNALKNVFLPFTSYKLKNFLSRENALLSRPTKFLGRNSKSKKKEADYDVAFR